MKPSGTTPFTIVVSGFCIDPSGVIVTCEHVISEFLSKSIKDQVAGIPDDKTIRQLPEVEIRRPFALFYMRGDTATELLVVACPIDQIVVRTDHDLGLIRAAPHKRFEGGFPFIEVANYGDLYEGLEIGTYGFPLGTFLYDQIGTLTSSLTRGTLSSIVPTDFASEEHVKLFQLDLTATYGNSGGPVFCIGSGRAFGVLQGGIVGADGTSIIPGIVKAEPIYPIIRGGEIDFLRSAPLGSLPSAETIQAHFKPPPRTGP